MQLPSTFHRSSLGSGARIWELVLKLKTLDYILALGLCQ